MQEAINIFIRSIFIENMIFAYFLGMCTFLAISKNVKTAIGLGIAVIFLLTITVPINYLLENYLLKPGALQWLGDSFKDVDLSMLTLLVFIAVLASVTQILALLIEKYSPSLYATLGIFLPLLAVNCAIFGGSLFMQQKEFPNIGYATVYGLGSGVGWFLAIVGLAAIRERLEYSDIPKPLRGLGITFIITALMGIAFMSFSGIKL
ncbi:Na+-transporting NADH:ubiquinone oxidoreductase subunit E [Dysgonomonas alginatilytica]|uniref:Na(+)-translocating NADH-quinone reductase subunit E n=1 Tax=Dysgonomonas alginatilytica TaxID=1605892 RepID=A0A2V3PQ60_9BACT|nr:NADH:ubiquinone reductase (Na(+)-transporting) subunit E [Dysgonomonas alginatilytica]PXV65078.1 Na+-transporting NADH:ubiquinone oxidoreductase subunit E [Dysgonomonas alginatilytica]